MRPYPLPYQFISLALALLVLAASIGLPVQQRTCRLSGRSTARIAWEAATAGAFGSPEKIPDSGIAAACYAYSLQVHQLSPETSAFDDDTAELLPVPADWLALPVSSGFRRPPLPRFVVPVLLASRQAGQPPPRPAGRALLVRVGLLVV